jgi:hypothetical protein
MINFISNKPFILLLMTLFGISSCRSMSKDISTQAKNNTDAIMELHETTLEASRGFYTSPLGFLYALCFLWVTYLTVKILFASPKGTN